MISCFILPVASNFFDKLKLHWDKHSTHQNISRLLVYAFFVGITTSVFLLAMTYAFNYFLREK
jgi:hypothetical protein